MSRLKYLLLVLTLISAKITRSDSYRLPTTVLPSQYQIHLNLPEEAFTANSDTFSGYEIITLKATESGVNEIKIHAAHEFITINSAHLNSAEIEEFSIDDATDIATFQLTGNLSSVNSALLYISFSSKLSTKDMYGFYKSSYVTNDGDTKYLATTQFQPTYARRAFPCFDEPAFKATFEIFITYPQEFNALSNMPGQLHDSSDIIGQNNTNLITTHFPTTALMPTYLVAFIISDFTCTNGVNIEVIAVPYRVCSSNDTAENRQFALTAGVSLMRTLNSYTHFSYSSMGFPKIDQVAIPDFAAGAMENWGLVTYREQYLLWDDVESTNAEQQNVATIIAHEFAHQWFGNLVTMKWWSETFLNEGFATYFEFFTPHQIYLDWGLDKQFIVKVLQPMLEEDSLNSSHPLQHAVNSDAEILSRFSSVSYYKGGSIFRMVEHILGTEIFTEGLKVYLSTHAFENTIPDDLWTILDAQLIDEQDRSRFPAGIQLNEIIKNWVEKPGYPILELQNDGDTVKIAQKGRFLLNGEDADARWYVPITYSTDTNPDFSNTTTQSWLLPDDDGVIEISFTNENWIILNNLATGYYRVNYNNLWNPLITALEDTNFSGIPDINRAVFVDDAFQLARALHINYTKVFNIIQFLRNDTSHFSWIPAINGFNFLLNRVGENSKLGQAISNHILDLISNIYGSVSWLNLNKADHAYTLKQVDILTISCRLGLKNCVDFALLYFAQFKLLETRPTPNLRNIIYCNALRYGNDTEDWNFLWASYNSTSISGEKVRILQSLGCIQNEEILNNYLDLSLDPNSGIKPQDALTVFTGIYTASNLGLNVAFNFLKEHHQLMLERYQTLNAFTRMINGLAERFTTEKQLNELREFIETGGLSENLRNAANSALAAAESNLIWLSQHNNELNEYFEIEPDKEDPEDPENQEDPDDPENPDDPGNPDDPDESKTTTTTTTPTSPDSAPVSISSSLTLIVSLILFSLVKTW